MILRILNILVIGTLVLAAAYVYRIKFEATVQAEHLAKLRDQVRRERNQIAALRAEWGELDDPARIQALAQRFLKLQIIKPTQFSSLDNLPPQPPTYLQPGAKDPIAEMIQHFVETPTVTGSIPPSADAAKPPATVAAAPVPAPVTTVPGAAPATSGAAIR